MRYCHGLAAIASIVAAGALLSGCAQVHVPPPWHGPPPAPQGVAPPSATVQPPPLTVAPMRTTTLGTSVRGQPIFMQVFGNGPDRVLAFGGIHGNEPSSACLAAALAAYLAAHPNLWAGRTIAVIPALNPDGLARHTRVNAHGVDLNRNFPARNWRSATDGGVHGAAPASEPETRALLAAIEQIRPTRIVTIHSIFRGRHGNNFDGPARDLALAMASGNRYAVLPIMGYDTPGSFGSWAGIDRQIPTITLELPRDLPAERCWTENQAALLAFVTFGTPVGK